MLTFDKIKEITFGAIKIEQTEKGICFYRLSEKQIGLFADMHEKMGIDALCTTGIRLDFLTDGTDMSFTVGAGGKYEVLTDGVLRERFILEENGTVDIPIGDAYGHPTEEKRVTLVFPSHSQGILKSIDVKNSTFIEKHKYTGDKLLFLGDSITQGWNTYFNTTSYAWRLALLMNSDFVNQGIGRTYFLASGLDKTVDDAEKIIISYGTNDFGHYADINDFKKNVTEYFSAIKAMYGTKKVYVISPIWRRDHTGRAIGNIEDLTEVIKAQAEKSGFFHINGLTLVPPNEMMYTDDFLHPQDLGMASYAERLFIMLNGNR